MFFSDNKDEIETGTSQRDDNPIYNRAEINEGHQ